ARGLRKVAMLLVTRSSIERARGPLLLGLNHARKVVQADPDGADGWKEIGVLLTMREPPFDPPVPRFRMPFDPAVDLSAVRTTYALRRAVDAAPRDHMSLLMLEKVYEERSMTEAALPLLDRIVALTTVNTSQATARALSEAQRAKLQASLGDKPWENLN